jgi:hypothetical protein
MSPPLADFAHTGQRHTQAFLWPNKLRRRRQGATASILANRSSANSTRPSALTLATISAVSDSLLGWCDNPCPGANGGAGVFADPPPFRIPTARPLAPRGHAPKLSCLRRSPASHSNATFRGSGADYPTEAPFPRLAHRPHAAPQHYRQSCIGPSINCGSRTSRPTMVGEFR